MRGNLTLTYRTAALTDPDSPPLTADFHTAPGLAPTGLTPPDTTGVGPQHYPTFPHRDLTHRTSTIT